MRTAQLMSVTAAAALLCLTACAPDSHEPSTDPASPVVTTDEPGAASVPPDGVALFADYPRYLWHKRRLSVATTNDRDQPIEVSLIALRTDHFLDLEPEAKSNDDRARRTRRHPDRLR